MNVSTRWLRDLVPGLTGSAEELAERLALRGAPVDSIDSPGAGLADIVVGKVISARQHPNADRLRVCEVDGGDGIVQVVCGAPNVKGGAFYPFAPVGALLPGDFAIKKAKIRGEVSQGMLCSARELGLGVDHDGILELEGDYSPGESFVAALGLDDSTLDVETTVNRGDLLSHVGVARELVSEAGGEVRLPAIPGMPTVSFEYVADSPTVVAGGVSVSIEAPDLCSRYLAAVVRGVSVGPSPTWLQERLRGAGARPINNVVDATNYVMLELGQPLHAFDLRNLAGSQIVVRRATASETAFVTLDDQKRAVTPDMLMICDAQHPVALAGVMGGQNSEVGPETVDLLLECALFEPRSTRATRKALNLSTDASYRYERGVDPDGMDRAIERAISIILATAGGELDGPVLDCCPVPFRSQVVELRLARIERLLGIPFKADYVERLLRPLGFVVEGRERGTLQVRVPGFRSYDVTREVDLIEEVARTHGYDTFPDALGPGRPGSVPDHPAFQLEDRLRDALVSHGLHEAHTPAFCPPGEGDVEVANPLTTTEPFMRRALLPSLVRRVEYNLAHGNRDVRLFEIGTSFRRAGKGEPPREESHLAGILTGRREPPHWSRTDEAFTIWDVKGLFEDMARRVWGATVLVQPGVPTGAVVDPALCFVATKTDGQVVGEGGRVLPAAIDTPVWAGDVWAFEIVLPADPLPPEAVVVRPLPQYPPSERDLALLVPDGLEVRSVSAVMTSAGGDDLESVALFDVYTGSGVPAGMRSVGFRLRFRSPNRTLKDKEVDRTMASVLKRLEEELGVKARG